MCSRLVVYLVLLHLVSGDARYNWACTKPGDDGKWYIPSITDHSGFETANTDGKQLNIYRLPPDISEDCYGTVVAIKYCYKHNITADDVLFTFNWTVLILQESNLNNRPCFRILDTITIQSCSVANKECTEMCCDTTKVAGINLSRNLTFGITESSQGNTPGATLLGFHETKYPEYRVDTLILSKSAGMNLSVGTLIPIPEVEPNRGLRMLWFVVASNVVDIDEGEVSHDKDKNEGRKRNHKCSTNEEQHTDKLPTGPIGVPPTITSDVTILGGVIGGVLSLTVVITSTVVVIVLMVFAKKCQSEMRVDNGSESDGQQGYDYVVYNGKSNIGVAEESITFNTRGELEHEYSLLSESQQNEQMNNETEKQDILYVVPALDEHSLYSQLSQINIHTFTRDAVVLTDVLGSGQFGTVHRGQWVSLGLQTKIEVAIKTLKEAASQEDKVKFLQEAAIMGQFSHPNIVQLYGMVTEGEPLMLIIELLHKGDLHAILCNILTNSSLDLELQINAELPHTLLSYCRQVASGMQYLGSKAFVHRDLAARNILMSENGVCKIADFGMSRDLADANYYVSHGDIIPVKWTAPEAIHYKKYSTASDVWSYGCIMYEIWSLGHKPYEAYQNQVYITIIDEGIRLAPPPGCPRIIYKLMIDCWHPDSSSRPNFVTVVQQLSLSDTKLLRWSEEDKATYPEAATLGAGLEKAADLYKDLQDQYKG